jgi:AraC-like DNA-binding protein
MQSRLDLVKNWDQRAHAAGYSASKMARELGVTVRSLQTFFQARFRLPPREWLFRSRMRAAVRLLRSGNSVKAVASELGYKQASHFSREFKRFFAVGPRDFTFGQLPCSSPGGATLTSRLDTKLRL